MTTQAPFVVTFLLAIVGATLGLLPSASLRQVYQFPNGTWVENIAVRPNGNLLVTLVNVPELWEVIDSGSQPSHARLVDHFQDAQMATGITEISADIFAVITPNSVWKIDFNREERITHLATLSAGNLNGAATLSPEIGTVAISDSEAGLVWLLDTNTGNYTIMLKDETMAANTKEGPLLGINGLNFHAGYVYYVNTPERLFCRIPVDIATNRARGQPEVISQGLLADDFAISPHGVAYLAGLRENIVTRVFMNGTRETIAGSRESTALMSATSAAFGRCSNSHLLYITTGGETDHPTNDTTSKGGKVMVITVEK